jgi:hypothetical protein
MLMAFLLHQIVDELGDELPAHLENIPVTLQAIIHLTAEQMPAPGPDKTGAKPAA